MRVETCGGTVPLRSATKATKHGATYRLYEVGNFVHPGHGGRWPPWRIIFSTSGRWTAGTYPPGNDHIFPQKWHFKDDIPNFPRSDMLVPWRVPIHPWKDRKMIWTKPPWLCFMLIFRGVGLAKYFGSPPSITRWWFQTFLFSPTPGEDSQFD